VSDLESVYATPPSEFVFLDGMNVHYRDEGSGEAVLLLHGTGSSLHTWDGWTDSLSDSLRLLRLDLPGFGLTGPHPDRDYSISRYVELIASLIASKGITRLHLVGNSLGGHIAWQFALDHPDQVISLVLIDPAGYPPDPDVGSPLVFSLARIPVINSALTYISPATFVRRSLLDVYADETKVTESLIRRHTDLALRPGNRQAFVDRMQQSEPNRFNQIGRISQPVLVLWGEKDRWTPVSKAALFDSALSDVRVLRYPDAGHVPMEEIPEKTARDALAFFRKVSESSQK
jgi:pimeloyl-ACP methyl ester carboxylesterase